MPCLKATFLLMLVLWGSHSTFFSWYFVAMRRFRYMVAEIKKH